MSIGNLTLDELRKLSDQLTSIAVAGFRLEQDGLAPRFDLTPGQPMQIRLGVEMPVVSEVSLPEFLKPVISSPEAEQTDCANGAELAAREIIRKTVRLVNKHQWPHVVASLSEIKIGGKNGIDIKMTSSNIAETRDVLGEHVGTHVQIVMADSDAFMAERAPAQIDRDQPEMDLQDGEGFDGPEANRPDEADLE